MSSQKPLSCLSTAVVTLDSLLDPQKFYMKESSNDSNLKTAFNIIKKGHPSDPPCRFCDRKGVPCIKSTDTRRCALCAARGRNQKTCEEVKTAQLKRLISQVDSPAQQPERSTRDITPLTTMMEEETTELLEAVKIVKPSIPSKEDSPRTSPSHSISAEPPVPPVRSPSAGPSASVKLPSPVCFPSAGPSKSDKLLSPADPAVVVGPCMDLTKQFEKLAEELKKELDKKFSELFGELEELRSDFEAFEQKKPEPPDIIGALLGNHQQSEKLAEELKKELAKKFSKLFGELDEFRSEFEAFEQKKPEPPDIIGGLLGGHQNVSLKLEMSRTQS